MLPGFAEELRARRQIIKSAWERRLRSESVTSALANPDTLVMMMDRTFDELLASIAESSHSGRGARDHFKRTGTGCLCGLNPLLAYFRTFAITLCGVVEAGGKPFAVMPPESLALCLDETLLVLREIAQRDVAAFCAVCQSQLSAGHRSFDREEQHR